MTPDQKTRSKEIVKQKLRERKKLSKQLLKEKRARLMVKNLPFKITEDALREYFGKFGEILSIDILKKPDGKLVGCGFIQFKLVQKAAKARHHTNGKEFLGRKLEVEFAKAQTNYKKNLQNANEIARRKTEILNPPSNSNESENQVEFKSDSENDLGDNENQDHIESEPEDDGCDIEGSDSCHAEENSFINPIDESNENNNRHFSHDISEGKTVFIKNVPFDATNDDLKKCMLQFGRIYYALICYDKFTEHSKGTAFVKFLNKEDADLALNAGTELKLLGNILDCHPAIDRKEVQTKIKDKITSKSQPKDSRNLYLVKEGVIPPGSSSAQGVSSTDMTKRAQIEHYKTQMLRKLNMFISKERVVVHNLPPTWDDKKLRTLFQKYGGPGAVVKEARIMRDRKKIDASGVGFSKQYGFVAFTKHENALAALRNLNNNPNIFSVNKRPIIVFSIENKSAILAKQKRLEKSKLENQTKKSNFESSKPEKNNKRTQKFRRFLEKKKINKKIKPPDETVVPKYSGIRIDKSSK